MLHVIVVSAVGKVTCIVFFSSLQPLLTPTALCVKEGTKYALKLKNTGQRTYNGDGGMAKVKCSDGTTFTFSACSLSINGTNHMRGQIPQILYYR